MLSTQFRINSHAAVKDEKGTAISADIKADREG